MSRLTHRRLDTLNTLADATGRRSAVTITNRQPGLARGPFTSSVLGFKPDADRRPQGGGGTPGEAGEGVVEALRGPLSLLLRRGW